MATLSLDVQELLGRLWEETQSPEDKEKLRMAVDALRFIASTGQSYDFKDYLKSLDANAPPLVIASFNTLEEAEVWLNEHPRPPDQSYVLVAGEYHIVMYFPDRNHRSLIRHPALEFYLEELTREGLPAPVASFPVREEAEDWLARQLEPPRQVFITIAGEVHLVAYHHRIDLRAIYPISQAAKPATGMACNTRLFMSIRQIEDLAGQVAHQLFTQFLSLSSGGESYELRYDSAGELEGDFNDAFSHQGIYAFRVSKGGRAAIAYVGKTERGNRLRQQLTGKNRDGSNLKPSVKNKHEHIKKAIREGYTVHVCLYVNRDFGKPSLACIELATIQTAKAHLEKTFPTVKSWNERSG